MDVYIGFRVDLKTKEEWGEQEENHFSGHGGLKDGFSK